MLSHDTPLVVGVPFSTKQKVELGVVALFVHGHLLKFGAIASDKVGEFINDVL